MEPVLPGQLDVVRHQQPSVDRDFGESIPPPSHPPSTTERPVPRTHVDHHHKSRENKEGDEEEQSGLSLQGSTPSTLSDHRHRKRKCNGKESNDVSPPPAKKRASEEQQLLWDVDTHRLFCRAIFEIGLSHASPAVLLEHMENATMITSERVKSHLQKYRRNKAVKSRNEFFHQYDRFMDMAATSGGTTDNKSPRPCEDLTALAAAVLKEEQLTTATLSEQQQKQVSCRSPLPGGYGAAFLTVAVRMSETTSLPHNDNKPLQPPVTAATTTSPTSDPPLLQHMTTIAQVSTALNGQHSVMMPVLTDQEKASPVGASMMEAYKMLPSLCQHVLHIRNSQGKDKDISTALV